MPSWGSRPRRRSTSRCPGPVPVCAYPARGGRAAIPRRRGAVGVSLVRRGLTGAIGEASWLEEAIWASLTKAVSCFSQPLRTPAPGPSRSRKCHRRRRASPHSRALALLTVEPSLVNQVRCMQLALDDACVALAADVHLLEPEYLAGRRALAHRGAGRRHRLPVRGRQRRHGRVVHPQTFGSFGAGSGTRGQWLCSCSDSSCFAQDWGRVEPGRRPYHTIPGCLLRQGALAGPFFRGSSSPVPGPGARPVVSAASPTAASIPQAALECPRFPRRARRLLALEGCRGRRRRARARRPGTCASTRHARRRGGDPRRRRSARGRLRSAQEHGARGCPCEQGHAASHRNRGARRMTGSARTLRPRPPRALREGRCLARGRGREAAHVLLVDGRRASTTSASSEPAPRRTRAQQAHPPRQVPRARWPECPWVSRTVRLGGGRAYGSPTARADHVPAADARGAEACPCAAGAILVGKRTARPTSGRGGFPRSTSSWWITRGRSIASGGSSWEARPWRSRPTR